MSLLSLSKKILRSSEGEKKKEKAPKKTAAKKTAKKTTTSGNAILAGKIELTAIMTEKSIASQANKTIMVKVIKTASKYDIANAVEGLFGVKVTSVRTMISHPKIRRRGTSVGKTNVFKKAYVTVDDISKLNTAP